MKNNVKFVAHYDSTENDAQKRAVALSACNKMLSVMNCIKSGGRTVEVVSVASTYGEEDALSKTYCSKDGVWIRLFYAVGRRKYLRIVNRVILPVQALAYLIGNTSKNDIVFAYHSVYLIKLLYILKLFTKCKLILEMEEIYGDVSGREDWRKKELRFARIADAYIFPTQLLDELVNKDKKPSVIIHGTYEEEKGRYEKFDDGKIHVVYAGTLDPRKGGAVAAVAAAAELPENYHVHILGIGSDEQKRDIAKQIEKASCVGRAKVTYDGSLSGEAYVCFLQACDIGLSTQNPDAQFNETSFPSKILSYMANGLRVISVQIEAVEKSAVGDMITYYREQTPEAIAKAILSVDFSVPYDSRARIRELNKKFQNNLEKLMEKVGNE